MPITKMEEQSDGSVIVSGLCTSDTVDLDDQIIDLDFSRKGLQTWAESFGNVRQMHSTNLPPAGKAIAVDTTRPEGVYLTARIVEPIAVKLVKEGVYGAFSVGISKPRIVRDSIAKQGRVIDGIFSEVSIVDFPALPTAKFTVVKRSKTEIKKIEKTLTPIGTIIKVNSTEKDSKSMDENKVIKGEACDGCDGSGVDAAGEKCMKCMGKGVAEPDLEKKKLPKEDEEVTENLDEADEAIESAKDAQSRDNAAHVAGEEEEEEEEEDEAEEDEEVEKSIGASYALRRAHDVLCDAYSNSLISAVHPAVEKNGVKSVISPEILRSVLSTSGETLTNDQFIGLASAVGAAAELSRLSDNEIISAKAEVHKAFADAYPSSHPTPASVTPGQFTRSYISAGRAPLSSTGSSARIPVSNSSVDAEDFSRGPLTAGHEAPSPANSGSRSSSTLSAADQIAAIARDTAANAIVTLHDHIASAYPNICPMDHGLGTVAGFSSAGVSTLDTDGNIKPIKNSAKPQLTKAERDARKALKREKKIAKARKLLADNEDTNTKVMKGVSSSTNEVLIDTAALTEIVKSVVAQQTREQFAAFDEILNAVQTEVEKLGSEPDPSKAPIRGTVAVERVVEKTASEAEMLRRAAEDDLREQVDYLTTLTKSGNAELRMRAESQLRSILERAAFENN